MDKTVNISQRDMTSKERKKLSRGRWILLPVYVIAILIIAVAYFFESLPIYARIAVTIIPTIAAIIFTLSVSKATADLREGRVEIIQGIVGDKRKFGGNISKGTGSKRNNNATFYVFINGTKYTVPSRIYAKAKIGSNVELVKAPKSGYFLGIKET